MYEESEEAKIRKKANVADGMGFAFTSSYPLEAPAVRNTPIKMLPSIQFAPPGFFFLGATALFFPYTNHMEPNMQAEGLWFF